MTGYPSVCTLPWRLQIWNTDCNGIKKKGKLEVNTFKLLLKRLKLCIFVPLFSHSALKLLRGGKKLIRRLTRLPVIEIIAICNWKFSTTTEFYRTVSQSLVHEVCYACVKAPNGIKLPKIDLIWQEVILGFICEKTRSFNRHRI